MKKPILMILSASLLGLPAIAAPPAPPAEAKAMLDKAVAYYKAQGRKKILNQSLLPFPVWGPVPVK